MTPFPAQIVFPALGVAGVLFGWPLARRLVPPNHWYGVRVPETMRDRDRWYEVNALCGTRMIRAGLVQVAVSVGAARYLHLGPLPYLVVCGAVMVGGSLWAILGALKRPSANRSGGA